MSDISIQLGHRIKELRLRKGLSQEKLALEAGLNTSYTGYIERGERCPSLKTLEKIAKALDVPFHELFQQDAGLREKRRNSAKPRPYKQ